MTTAKATKTPAKNTKSKPAARKKSTKSKLSPEQRIEYIQYAAYLRAEQRGFQNGSPEGDWIEAEQEIDKQLA